ncbi:MAG: YdjY domain-containing protein [Gemmataceae bacterium]|nr:YdjY domain-containing protein [Gemmataceae bacterium]
MLLLVLTLAGCREAPRDEPPSEKPAAPPPVADGKRVKVGKDVWLEVLPGNKRRVLVEGAVCLREGMLELLLTRKGKKEHEAIVAADVDARKIHEALLLAGARVGKPAQYTPSFKPPTGQAIDVRVRWEEEGKRREVPANEWIKDSRAGKELDGRWVFAGSILVEPTAPGEPTRYMANEGDLISVVNFDTALLDVPFRSSDKKGALDFEAWTGRIPPKGTPVTVVLTPVAP